MPKFTNEVGKKYGRLTVLSRAETNKGGKAAWVCACSCGKGTVVSGDSLRRGATKSCGCLRHDAPGGVAKNEIGNSYGRLTVIKRAKNPKGKGAYWLCKCSCGTEVIVFGSYLRRGTTKSCGCFRKEKSHELHSLPTGEASFNNIIYRMKQSAKKRGHRWNLTRDQVRWFTSQPCNYCGAAPSSQAASIPFNGAYLCNGLDRINNEQGYSLENVVPCCGACNRAKGKMTQSDFFTWIHRLCTFRQEIERKNETLP